MLELSEEQLKHLNKDALVIIAASLQDQLRSMAQQLKNAKRIRMVCPPEYLNTDFLMKNSQKNFLMAVRNFRRKSTSVCISFRKPLLLMSITFMSTHPKTMMAPSSGLSVPWIYLEAVSLPLHWSHPSSTVNT